MRIERADGYWVLVDGRAPSEARWQLDEAGVEVVSPSGRVYPVEPDDVPAEIAVGLLALRDARRFLTVGAGQSAGGFALRAWLEASREPMLVGRVDASAGASAWMVYRFTFLTATAFGPSGDRSCGGDPSIEVLRVEQETMPNSR